MQGSIWLLLAIAPPRASLAHGRVREESCGLRVSALRVTVDTVEVAAGADDADGASDAAVDVADAAAAAAAEVVAVVLGLSRGAAELTGRCYSRRG